MDTNKPMALRLADKYEHEGFLSDHKFAQNQWCYQAAAELRRLHAENSTLQSCYDAACMEVASLHNRLEASQKTNDDLAKRTHAMDAKNLGLLHALTAEQDENHALHQQLAAIGAGGVEPLRKRECLHHVAEQAQIDSDVQRDAERYRWLRNMNDWHAEPRIEDADGTKWQLTFYTPQIIEDQSDDNNLDSAIDAASAAQLGV